MFQSQGSRATPEPHLLISHTRVYECYFRTSRLARPPPPTIHIYLRRLLVPVRWLRGSSLLCVSPPSRMNLDRRGLLSSALAALRVQRGVIAQVASLPPRRRRGKGMGIERGGGGIKARCNDVCWGVEVGGGKGGVGV